MSSAKSDAELLARSLAGHPAAVARLRAEHVDEGTGRCRTCRPSDSGPHPRFPCRLHALAELARSLR